MKEKVSANQGGVKINVKTKRLEKNCQTPVGLVGRVGWLVLVGLWNAHVTT